MLKKMKDAKILKKMKKHEKMSSGTPANDLFAILIFITILSKCTDNINLPTNNKHYQQQKLSTNINLRFSTLVLKS